MQWRPPDISLTGAVNLRSTRDSAGSLVHSAVKLAAAFNNHNNQATTAPAGPSAPQDARQANQGPAYQQQGGGQGGGRQGGDAPQAGTQAMAAPAPPAPPAGGLLSMLPAFLRPQPPPDAAPATQRGLAEVLPAAAVAPARRAPRRLADGGSAGGGAAGSGGTTQNAVLALAGAASNAWKRISGVPGAQGARPGPRHAPGAGPCACAAQTGM